MLSFLTLLTIKTKSKNLYLETDISIIFTILVSFAIKFSFPTAQRNIDNFLIFSAKPWDFFIQPSKSLINYTEFQSVLPKNNIYFNYFENEHSV